MAKSNRQNPPRPKEFQNSPFSTLKNIAKEIVQVSRVPENPEKITASQKTETPDDGLNLFLQAVADIKPINAKNPKGVPKELPKPTSLKKPDVVPAAEDQDRKIFVQEITRLRLDKKFADAVSDDGELQPLSNNRLRQVKRGVVAVDYQLDLHGLNREEALSALPIFLQSASRKGQKAVLVITGKGKNSEDEPVLNQAVASWLRDAGRELVVEYAPAPREMGGSGAYVVFLRQVRTFKESN